VCHCSVPNDLPHPDTRALQPANPPHPAKSMMPPQRRQLALEALASTETVSRLAGQHAVSRKFVYRQAAKAERPLTMPSRLRTATTRRCSSTCR